MAQNSQNIASLATPNSQANITSKSANQKKSQAEKGTKQGYQSTNQSDKKPALISKIIESLQGNIQIQQNGANLNLAGIPEIQSQPKNCAKNLKSKVSQKSLQSQNNQACNNLVNRKSPKPHQVNNQSTPVQTQNFMTSKSNTAATSNPDTITLLPKTTQKVFVPQKDTVSKSGSSQSTHQAYSKEAGGTQIVDLKAKFASLLKQHKYSLVENHQQSSQKCLSPQNQPPLDSEFKQTRRNSLMQASQSTTMTPIPKKNNLFGEIPSKKQQNLPAQAIKTSERQSLGKINPQGPPPTFFMASMGASSHQSQQRRANSNSSQRHQQSPLRSSTASFVKQQTPLPHQTHPPTLQTQQNSSQAHNASKKRSLVSSQTPNQLTLSPSAQQSSSQNKSNVMMRKSHDVWSPQAQKRAETLLQFSQSVSGSVLGRKKKGQKAQKTTNLPNHNRSNQSNTQMSFSKNQTSKIYLSNVPPIIQQNNQPITSPVSTSGKRKKKSNVYQGAASYNNANLSSNSRSRQNNHSRGKQIRSNSSQQTSSTVMKPQINKQAMSQALLPNSKQNTYDSTSQPQIGQVQIQNLSKLNKDQARDKSGSSHKNLNFETQEEVFLKMKKHCEIEIESQLQNAISKILYQKREAMTEIKQYSQKKRNVSSSSQERVEKRIQELEANFSRNAELHKNQIDQYYSQLYSKNQIKQKFGEFEENQFRFMTNELQKVTKMWKDTEKRLQDSMSQNKQNIQMLGQQIEEVDQNLANSTIYFEKLIEDAKRLIETKCEKMLTQFEQNQVLATKSDLHQLESNVQIKFQESQILLQKTLNELIIVQVQDGVNETKEKVKDEIKMELSNEIQSEMSQLDNQLVQIRKEIRESFKTEFDQRDRMMQERLEKSKQDFYKAINGNMKILDNLINDYTTRTQEQIKAQLRACATNSSAQGENTRSYQQLQEGKTPPQIIPRVDTDLSSVQDHNSTVQSGVLHKSQNYAKRSQNLICSNSASQTQKLIMLPDQTAQSVVRSIVSDSLPDSQHNKVSSLMSDPIQQISNSQRQETKNENQTVNNTSRQPQTLIFPADKECFDETGRPAELNQNSQRTRQDGLQNYEDYSTPTKQTPRNKFYLARDNLSNSKKGLKDFPNQQLEQPIISPQKSNSQRTTERQDFVQENLRQNLPQTKSSTITIKEEMQSERQSIHLYNHRTDLKSPDNRQDNRLIQGSVQTRSREKTDSDFFNLTQEDELDPIVVIRHLNNQNQSGDKNQPNPRRTGNGLEAEHAFIQVCEKEIAPGFPTEQSLPSSNYNNQMLEERKVEQYREGEGLVVGQRVTKEFLVSPEQSSDNYTVGGTPDALVTNQVKSNSSGRQQIDQSQEEIVQNLYYPSPTHVNDSGASFENTYNNTGVISDTHNNFNGLLEYQANQLDDLNSHRILGGNQNLDDPQNLQQKPSSMLSESKSSHYNLMKSSHANQEDQNDVQVSDLLKPLKHSKQSVAQNLNQPYDSQYQNQYLAEQDLQGQQSESDSDDLRDKEVIEESAQNVNHSSSSLTSGNLVRDFGPSSRQMSQSQARKRQENYSLRSQKPGSNLPVKLQRKGNEIIHQVLLDEVILALDEVLYLSRDKLQDVILAQQSEIVKGNRNLIQGAVTNVRQLNNLGGVGNSDLAFATLDNSDRYELSDSNDQSLPQNGPGAGSDEELSIN